MRIYDKIVEDIYEPQATNVLWLRPLQDGFAFYRYTNGRWEVMRVMNDKGSSSPEDDVPYDFDGMAATNLSDLKDVELSTLTEGQVLKFNGSTWENGIDEGSVPGPDTVGTEQIIDNSVEMEDLHDDVKGKIQKTYDISDESLIMDFDIQP